MSQEESNPLPTPQPNQNPSTSVRRKIVEFDERGKAIGPYAAKYASKIGDMTRQHCPPIYSQWHEVPTENKDDVLKGVVANYIIPDDQKEKLFKKANKLWKNWKTTLRRHMDNYETVQEKKAHPRKGVKKEDWERFIDLELKEEACILREKGKASRKNLKNPHTTGRRGSARTAEILLANDPTNLGTRTDIFLVTHTRKDGSFLSEEVQEKMNEINAIVDADPSSKMKDLDHDPVAQVYGHDGGGCTRGYGDNVSKTALMVAEPYKRKAQEEQNTRLELQNALGDLRKELAEEKKARKEMQEQLNAFLSRQGAFQEPTMRCSTSSNPSQEVHTRLVSPQSPYFPPSQRMCELKSLSGKHVSWGRILTALDGDADITYNIIVDGIYDLDAELFNADGKIFGDINIGETIQWLKVLTCID